MDDLMRIDPRTPSITSPAPVATDGGWNWPLIMRLARGVGAALFVWAVMQFFNSPGNEMRFEKNNRLAVIGAIGAGLFAAGIQRAIRHPSAGDQVAR